MDKGLEQEASVGLDPPKMEVVKLPEQRLCQVLHTNCSTDGRVGDAGVMLNPEARGKGYAYEAMRMTVDHALRILQLDEVTISMTKENTAMRGLMDKKFRLLPKEFKGDHGMELQYSIKKEEWLPQVHL